MTLPLPTEDVEQQTFVQWLRLNNIKHWRTPNETYTTSWKQKSKNKALGVSAGVPDLFIALPGIGLLAIEMKRRKRGVVSPQQREWIETLNTIPGVQAFVARGSDEAIAIVQSFITQSPLPSSALPRHVVTPVGGVASDSQQGREVYF